MGLFEKVKDVISNINEVKVGECFGNGDKWLICIEAGTDGKYLELSVHNSYKMEDTEVLTALKDALQNSETFIMFVKAQVVDTRYSRKLKKSFTVEEVNEICKTRRGEQSESGFQSIQDKMKAKVLETEGQLD